MYRSSSPERHCRGALALVAALLACAHVAVADTLLTLTPHGVQGSAIAIPDAPGLVSSPLAGTAVPSWTITAGDARSGSTAPFPRRLDLYQKIAGQLKLAAVVRVRYFATQGAWVPGYRMSEEMYFVPTKNGWKPLVLTGGVPAMLSTTSSALPNAQGYYASLTFSSTTGPLPIDAWAVHRITSSLSDPYP